MTARPTAIELKLTIDLISTICGMATMVTAGDLAVLTAEISRTDALMPIVDPTAYRASMDNLDRLARIVGAFATFRAAVLPYVEPPTK